MKILLAGGGSGGHVTPLKAIAASLRQEAKEPLDITVVTDRRFYSETKSVFANDTDAKLKKIFSGKYRRYKSKSFVWHIVHLPTLLKNIRDVFLLAIGTVQSFIYFALHKPDVVFCKGGFVCVPIGVVSKLFNVPLIIHDSDTRPGLTNRILSRWAVQIGTGMPTSFYPYTPSLMVYTGIPVNAEYVPVPESKQREYKASLGLAVDRPLLLVTGGGNGAISLNNQLIAAAPHLIQAGWSITHLVGKGKAEPVIRARSLLSPGDQASWLIDEFAPMLPRLLGADLVISRTSASTIQECANAKKTVIGIASAHLDDQKMNAEFFASKQAIISLNETALSKDGSDLINQVEALRSDAEKARVLAHNLNQEFQKPNAAKELANLIIEAANSASTSANHTDSISTEVERSPEEARDDKESDKIDT